MAARNAAIWAGPAEASKIATIPPPPSPQKAPKVSDLLLAGYRARFTQGYRAATVPLRAAVEALRSDDLEPLTGLKWFQRGAVTAGSLWDGQALLDLTDRWLRLTRRLGALTEAPIALVFGAIADSVAGRLDQAADRWAEMRELMPASQATGMFGFDSSAEGLLLAYRGEIARARGRIGSGPPVDRPGPERPGLDGKEYSRGGGAARRPLRGGGRRRLADHPQRSCIHR
jgi:hypothetical protein